MVTDTIERDVLIAAPAERVWALLTEAEHLGSWFGDAGAEIDLRPGGELVVHWREHGTSLARIVDVEPQRRFSLRWTPGDVPRSEQLADGTTTLIEFTLEPEGDGTRLRVVESGFAALRGSDEQRAETRAGNVRGWRQELDELVAYATRVAA